MKIDQTVKQETGYIALGTFVLSVLMQSVFLLIGRWDYTVLLGNLLGGGAAVLNFLLMGLTIQSAVQLEEKDAKAKMKASQSLRTLMLLLAAVLGAALPCFHLAAVLIPLFFPRITIQFRGIACRKTQNDGGAKME